MENKNIQNIYTFNLLKSYNIEYNKDYSFLISRIIDLNNSFQMGKLPMEEVAKKLLKIFDMSNSTTWIKTDRICLAKRSSFSNQLKIMSSSQNDNIEVTPLNPGYTCLITENSTLLSLKAGEIRQYGNIDSYKEAQKPIQRTLNILYKAGSKSGLTIPLHMDDIHIGYIFLNSATPYAYGHLTEEDYSILCLIQIVFENILTKFLHAEVNFEVVRKVLALEDKNQISLNTLKSNFENLFYEIFYHKVNVSLVINSDTNFLLTNRKFFHAIFFILKNIKNIENSNHIDIKVLKAENHIFQLELIFESSLYEEDKIRGFSKVFNDVIYKINDNKIIFGFKYEDVVNGSDYSIADFKSN